MATKPVKVAPAAAAPPEKPGGGSKKANVMHDFPNVVDLVEDKVRLRVLGVVTAVGLYIIIALGAFGLPSTSVALPDSLVFSSQVPHINNIGVPSEVFRSPRVRLLDESNHVFKGEEVSVGVRQMYQFSVRDTLDCSSDYIEAAAVRGTLEHLRVAEPCRAEFSGNTATSDQEGVASFRNLTMARGPPGDYVLTVSAQHKGVNVSTSMEMRVVSEVVFLEPLSFAPFRVPASAPWEEQPMVRVADTNKLPVRGVTCVAFAWHEANFFAPFQEEDFPSDRAGAYVDRADAARASEAVPVPKAFPRGQRWAKMGGAVSLPSDAAGIVRWTNLSVVTSTDEAVFPMVFCEGKVASLNAPPGRPARSPLAQAVPTGPRYVPPLILDTKVFFIELSVGGQSLDPTVRPTPATFALPNFALDGGEVREGSPLPEPPSVRVLDEAMEPLEGVVCIVVAIENDSYRLPNRHKVGGTGLRAGLPAITKWSKPLTGAESAGTDAEGWATFPDLRFGVHGTVTTGQASFTVQVCCEGVCSKAGGNYGLMPLMIHYSVSTSVAEVAITRQPVYLRVNGTAPGAVGEPKEYFDADPGVIRVTSGTGAAVPGKAATAHLVDLSTGARVAAEEAAVAVADPSSEYTGADGMLDVTVVLLRASPAVLALAAEDKVGVVYVVDGVASPASSAVALPAATAAALAGRCSTLRTLRPPPASALVGRPFGWTMETERRLAAGLAENAVVNEWGGFDVRGTAAAMPMDVGYQAAPAVLQAVDVLGNPVPDVLVTAVSVEEFARTNQFYRFGGEVGKDYQAVGPDGVARMEYDVPYNTGFKVFPGPRGDVLREGADGTLKMMYVGLQNRAAANITALAAANEASFSVPFQEHLQQSTSAFFTAMSAAVNSKYWSMCPEDEEQLQAVIREVDPSRTEVGECLIACVSEEFTVDVTNELGEILVLTRDLCAQMPSWGLQPCQFDPTLLLYDPSGGVTYTTAIIPYQYREGITASQLAEVGMVKEMEMLLLGFDGGTVPLKQLDVEFSQLPPYMPYTWKETHFKCPSGEVPTCHFSIEYGRVLPGFPEGYEPAADDCSDEQWLTSECYRYLVYDFMTIQFLVKGSDIMGTIQAWFVVQPGYAGEYTFVFTSDGIVSAPVTVWAESEAAAIEVVEQPRDVFERPLYGTERHPVGLGEVVPAPVLRVVDAQGRGLPGYRLNAWMVADDGAEAPVMFDVTMANKEENLAGTRRSPPSDWEGRVAWSAAEDYYIALLDGVPGCYRLQFGYFPCGEKGGSCSRTLGLMGMDASVTAIYSPVVETPICIATDVTLAVSQQPSDKTAVARPLAVPPGMALEVGAYAPALDWLFVAVVVPGSMDTPLAEYSSTSFRVPGLDQAAGKAGPLDDARAVSAQLSSLLDPGALAPLLAHLSRAGELPPPAKLARAAGMLTGNVCIFKTLQPVYGRCGPLARSSVGGYTRYSTTFDNLKVVTGAEGEELRFQVMRPIALIGVEDLQARDMSTLSTKVQTKTAPTMLSIAQDPRPVVERGQLFLVEVHVGLDSGVLMPYQTVQAHIVEVAPSRMTTVIEGAGAFLDGMFGASNQSVALDGSPAELAADRTVAMTDREGVAKFKLRVTSGTPGQYAVYFTSNGVTSKKSKPFFLVNPVHSVELLAPGGATHKGKGELPRTVELGALEVAVRDQEGAAVPGLEDSFAFNIFNIRDKEGAEAMKSVQELASGKGSAVDRLVSVVKLIVEGSKRLQARKVSTTARLQHAGPVRYRPEDGIYVFPEARLTVKKLGDYRIQVVAAGIASSSEAGASDQTVEEDRDKDRLWLDVLNNAVTFLVLVALWQANHPARPWWTLVLTLLLAGGVLVWINTHSSAVWRAAMWIDVGLVALFMLVAGVCAAVGRAPLEQFHEQRRRVFEAYVRRAMTDKKFLSEQSSARLAARSYPKQLKAVLGDLNGEKDAFFFPQRIIAAFIMSTLTVVSLVYTTIAWSWNLRKAIRKGQDSTTATIYKFLVQLEDLYYSRQFTDIPGAMEDWAYSQASSTTRAYEGLADAVHHAGVIASVVGCLMFFVSWFVFVLDVRMQILAARRGELQWLQGLEVSRQERQKYKIQKASSYIGMHIAIGAVAYFLTWAVLFVLLALLCWPTATSLVWDWALHNHMLIINLVWPIAFKALARITFLKVVTADTYIRFRGLWSVWEIIDLFLSVAAGVVLGILRWIVAVGVTLFGIMRIEKAVIPEWVDQLVPALDKHNLTCKALVLVCHSYNHPAFCVAAWTLWEDKRMTGSGRDALQDTHLISKRRRTVQLRWQVATLLIAHPKLQQVRKHRLPSEAEAKDEKGEEVHSTS